MKAISFFSPFNTHIPESPGLWGHRVTPDGNTQTFLTEETSECGWQRMTEDSKREKNSRRLLARCFLSALPERQTSDSVKIIHTLKQSSFHVTKRQLPHEYAFWRSWVNITVLWQNQNRIPTSDFQVEPQKQTIHSYFWVFIMYILYTAEDISCLTYNMIRRVAYLDTLLWWKVIKIIRIDV